MAEYVYSTPTEQDMLEIAGMIRPEDRKELVGLVGDQVEQELCLCLRVSEIAYICKRDGVPMAAFGVVRESPFDNSGIIWMVATTETAKHKIYTGKKTLEGIRAFLRDWDYLYNYIDAGNESTIKWLRWMGAKIYPAAPYGIYGLPYHKFTFGEG